MVIQFIAGGFNLQSEARGYLRTNDGKWFDLTGVTLHTNTAAFLHTIQFKKPDSPSYALFRKNLSNKRANAVENVLLEKLGKSAKRIKFKSYAKSNAKPIKSNRTEKTRSANRRVEIVVN